MLLTSYSVKPLYETVRPLQRLNRFEFTIQITADPYEATEIYKRLKEIHKGQSNNMEFKFDEIIKKYDEPPYEEKPYTNYLVRLADLKKAIEDNPYDPNKNIDGYMRYLKYNTPEVIKVQ